MTMKLLRRSRLAVNLSLGFRPFSSSCSYDFSNLTKRYNHLINNKDTPLLVNYGNGLLQMLTSFFLEGGGGHAVRMKQPVSVQLPKDFLVCGPCHGLFCLYSVDGEVLLWNPGTGDVKNLPSEAPSDHETKIQNVGFGFDSKASDYKVVKYITREFRNPHDKCVDKIIHDVRICSLSSKQWRGIPVSGEIESSLPFLSPGSVFADGACHWSLTILMADYKIDGISFDFAKEEFQIQCIQRSQADWLLPWECKIYNYKGQPAIFQYYCFEYNTRVQVWVKKTKKKNGVKTWVHQMEIGPFTSSICAPLIPLCVWKNDGLILASTYNELLYYKFVTKQQRKANLESNIFNDYLGDRPPDHYVPTEDIIETDVFLAPGPPMRIPEAGPPPQVFTVAKTLVPNPW